MGPWMGELIDEWVDGWVGGLVDGWMGGWMDGWLTRWLVGWLDGRASGNAQSVQRIHFFPRQTFSKDAFFLYYDFQLWANRAKEITHFRKLTNADTFFVLFNKKKIDSNQTKPQQNGQAIYTFAKSRSRKIGLRL